MKHKKKIIIISISIIALIAVIVAILMKKSTKEEILGTNEKTIIEFSDVFYDNGWNKSYISNIVDGVAIPVGYEYVQGEKENGLIIKDSNQNYYKWIPYNEDAKIDNINEYYKNISEKTTISYEEFRDIKLYGGFYISLINANIEYNKLKEIEEENYIREKNAITEKNIENDSINFHMITKDEIEQVLYFSKADNNLTKLGNSNTKYQIDKLVGTVDSNIEKMENENIIKYYGLEVMTIEGWTKSTGAKGTIIYRYNNNGEFRYITVPTGFSLYPFTEDKNGYIQYDKIFRIRSDENPELKFIWISTAHLDQNQDIVTASRAFILNVLNDYNKSVLSNLETNERIDEDKINEEGLKYALDGVDVTLSPEIEKSIKDNHGFYIAEGETWKYTVNGIISTSTTDTKDYQPSNGNYLYVNNDVNSGSITLGIMDKAYLEANKIANGVEEELENPDIMVMPTPTAAYEAAISNIIKDAPDAQKEFFENGAVDNSKTGKADTSPADMDSKDMPRTKGISGLTGTASEITGNVTDKQDIAPIITEAGDEMMINKTADWSSNANTQTAGNPGFDPLTEQDLLEKMRNTIGVRLCLFIADENRHAEYFKVGERAGNGYKIILKDKQNAPENLLIPKEVEGKKVAAVDCSGCTKIKNVLDQVTLGIEKESYKGCTNLQTITQIFCSYIGKSAFEGCKALNNIKILTNYISELENDRGIEEYAFKDCINLKKFVAGPVEIQNISIVSYKNVYHEGTFANELNGQIEVNYTDGTKEKVGLNNEDVKVEGIKNIKTNKKTSLQVFYKGIYAGEIKIKEINLGLKSCQINTEELKKEYNQGEEFNLQGLRLEYSTTDVPGYSKKVTISGRGNEEELENITIAGYDKEKIGEQEITIAFDNYKTTVKVIVNKIGGLMPGGSTEGGLMPGGSTEGGQMTGGPTEGGQMTGGPTEGGQMPGNTIFEDFLYEEGGLMPGGPTEGGQITGGQTEGGQMPGGSTEGGLMPGGPTEGGQTEGGLMPGGSTEGGLMPGGQTTGGQTTGGQTTGGQTTGGQTEGGQMPGGSTEGGLMPGGSTEGGLMPGGPTTGGQTTGGQMPEDVSEYVSYAFIDSLAFEGCKLLETIVIGGIPNEIKIVSQENKKNNLREEWLIWIDDFFKNINSLRNMKIGNKQYNRKTADMKPSDMQQSSNMKQPGDMPVPGGM